MCSRSVFFVHENCWANRILGLNLTSLFFKSRVNWFSEFLLQAFYISWIKFLIIQEYHVLIVFLWPQTFDLIDRFRKHNNGKNKWIQYEMIIMEHRMNWFFKFADNSLGLCTFLGLYSRLFKKTQRQSFFFFWVQALTSLIM